MKANKKHISLETAKLLKDCGVESEYIIQQSIAGCYSDGRYEIDEGFAFLPREKTQLKLEYSYPAYTWQEILWENSRKFFGNKKEYTLSFEGYVKDNDGNTDGKIDEAYRIEDYEYHSFMILFLLQQKKYQDADEYFRDNNLIK